jgi:RNA polymerase sigma factor (sigma-70 family)
MTTSRPPDQDSTKELDTPYPAGRAVFATTHWSVVLEASASDTTRAHTALGRLCQSYWYPLYAYVRRRGYNPEDAQDLTQEFFARLLEHNWLAQADQQRGRFRSFVLAALSHFLANEWDKAKAQKRGGRAQFIPLQLDTAETRYSSEPTDPVTPEQCYERRWAVTLLDAVLGRLQEEHVRSGKATVFEMLKPCLVGERSAQPYAALGSTLGITEGAVKVLVHRLRQRYRQLLREEIANTVATNAEIDDELRYLFAVLAR